MDAFARKAKTQQRAQIKRPHQQEYRFGNLGPLDKALTPARSTRFVRSDLPTHQVDTALLLSDARPSLGSLHSAAMSEEDFQKYLPARRPSQAGPRDGEDQTAGGGLSGNYWPGPLSMPLTSRPRGVPADLHSGEY